MAFKQQVVGMAGQMVRAMKSQLQEKKVEGWLSGSESKISFIMLQVGGQLQKELSIRSMQSIQGDQEKEY